MDVRGERRSQKQSDVGDVPRLALPAERVYTNLQRYGNTSAGSVPLALEEAVAAGQIGSGSRVLLSGFGAGLAWGTAVMHW